MNKSYNLQGLEAALIKAAADTTKEETDAKQALQDYEQNPTEESRNTLAETLAKLKKANPVHLNGGLYAETKDMLSRAKEMKARGNTVRGLLGYALSPFGGLVNTFGAPVRTLTRWISPTTNPLFREAEELKDLDPADKETNLRAAKELLDLYSKERPDPTQQMEAINTLKGQFSNNTTQAVGVTIGRAIRGAAAGPVGIVGAIPYVREGVADGLTAPHTALFNHMGWNGKSREEYENEEKEKN